MAHQTDDVGNADMSQRRDRAVAWSRFKSQRELARQWTTCSRVSKNEVGRPDSVAYSAAASRGGCLM